LVHINLTKIPKEKRFWLSSDKFIEKIKMNPIHEALRIQNIKDQDESLSNSQIAKQLGCSRVRITQILNLLKLSPNIQKQILNSDKNYTERQLRPFTQINSYQTQEKLFQKMS